MKEYTALLSLLRGKKKRKKKIYLNQTVYSLSKYFHLLSTSTETKDIVRKSKYSILPWESIKTRKFNSNNETEQVFRAHC